MYKIAILTNFMEFNPGYSLTGIVQDQIKMLSKYGHDIHLFVNEQYNDKNSIENTFNCTIHKTIPFSHLTDYRKLSDISSGHKQTAQDTANMLKKTLIDFDFAFTHDFIFTGWFLPYGMACQMAGRDLPEIRWLHWIHSIPTAMFDWWNIRKFGQRHKIIFPVKAERTRVAEQYKGTRNDVRIIPHIKDPRTWWDFQPDTCDFIDEYPGVMQADIVQIYPASSDRLAAKRIAEVIRIFSGFKKQGRTVCLVIANQWATGRVPREGVEKYLKLARRLDLKIDEEFIFTSEWVDKDRKPRYENGLPKNILRELMLLGNLFIFPTREESFGLVGPEAALSGSYMVFNKSLDLMAEIHGMNGLYVDFGSFHREFLPGNYETYYEEVSRIILGRMMENEAIMCKTHSRKNFNYDTIYNYYYGPILSEASTWV